MHRWSKQLYLECKLLFGNWIWLMLPVLFGAWMISSLINISKMQSQDLYMHVYEFHKIQHILTLSVAILLGILIIRRDLVLFSHDWVKSYPLSSFALITSKFVAGMFYLSLFTLVMSIVYTVFGWSKELTMNEIIKEVLFFVVQYQFDYMYTLALAMCLALIVTNRIVYMIGFGGWVFMTFFWERFIVEMPGLYFLKGFQLSQLLLDSFYMNEAWGPWLNRYENVVTQLFVLGLTFLLLTVTITIFQHIRPSRGTQRWKWISVCMVLVTLFTSFPYSQLWAERYGQMNVIDNHAPMARGDMQFQSFKVDQYKINIQRDQQDQLHVTAELTLPKPTDQGISFVLNHAFHLDQVTLDGKKISAKREHDWVKISTSEISDGNNPIQLTFQYHGKLMVWHYDAFQEQLLAFVKGDHVLLPDAIAWYPLPGDHYLFMKQNGVQFFDQFELQEPADFEVSLVGFPEHTYGTMQKKEKIGDQQIFAQKQVRGIMLLAGNLIEVTLPNESLKIVTTPSNRQEAMLFLERFSDVKKYLKKWVPADLDRLEWIYYLPFEMYAEKYSSCNALIGNSLIIGEQKHHNLDYVQLSTALTALLFQDIEHNITNKQMTNEDPYYVTKKIRAAFFYLVVRDHFKRSADQLEQGTENISKQLAFVNSLEPNTAIIKDIESAIQQGKIEQVKQVLEICYQRGLTMNMQGSPADKPWAIQDWQKVWNQVMSNE